MKNLQEMTQIMKNSSEIAMAQSQKNHLISKNYKRNSQVNYMSIEDLFNNLAARFGARYIDMWGCVKDTGLMKATWQKELEEFDILDIEAGLSLLKTKKFPGIPPTLPEFWQFCDSARQARKEKERSGKLPIQPLPELTDADIAARDNFFKKVWETVRKPRNSDNVSLVGSNAWSNSAQD